MLSPFPLYPRQQLRGSLRLSNQKILRKDSLVVLSCRIRQQLPTVLPHTYFDTILVLLVAQGAIPRRDDLRRFGSKMQIPGLQSIHNP